jgi:hypothetical protein
MRPTNDLVEISVGKGEVVVFGVTGFILKTNDSYLPRIALTNVSEQDFRALLESKTVYDTLTAFGNGAARTANSTNFESRLREIWSKGKSLSEKIRTRAAILDEMRGYNVALADYANSMAFANGASTLNQLAVSNTQVEAVSVEKAATQLEKADSRHDAHEAWKDYKQTSSQLDNDTVRANGAAALALSMEQNADAYRRNCKIYIARLAKYGVNVPTVPVMNPIPGLLMRVEVDAERTVR